MPKVRVLVQFEEYQFAQLKAESRKASISLAGLILRRCMESKAGGRSEGTLHESDESSD
jgi:hypothetical protein